MIKLRLNKNTITRLSHYQVIIGSGTISAISKGRGSSWISCLLGEPLLAIEISCSHILASNPDYYKIHLTPNR